MAKILVADDDADLRTVIENMLLMDNHSVTLAHNGEQALKELSNTAYDILILDLIMPDKDGVEVLMELRKSGKKYNIIAISGGTDLYEGTMYLEMAQKIGANVVLKKPFSFTELQNEVNKLLQKTT